MKTIKLNTLSPIMLLLLLFTAINAFSQGEAIYQPFASLNGWYADDKAAVGDIQAGSHAIVDGHLQVSMGSQSDPASDPIKYRGDLKWEAVSSADYDSVRPDRDVIMAIKFLGERPDGALKMEMHVAGGSWFNRGGSKYSPTGSIVTTNNNTIYYFTLADDGTYTGTDTFAIDRINFALADNIEDSTYVLDWIATYPSLEALQEAKNITDDGSEDSDEVLVQGVTQSFNALNGWFVDDKGAVGDIQAGAHAVVNGHLQVSMGSQSDPASDPVKYRGDLKWEAAGVSEYDSVKPGRDVLMAIKFIGDRPDGALKMEMHVAGGSWFNRGGSKYSPTGSITTSNNNTIYYFTLSDDGTYIGADTFAIDKINFAIADNIEDSIYVIDWIATYPNLETLTADKDWKDDGPLDIDELIFSGVNQPFAELDGWFVDDKAAVGDIQAGTHAVVDGHLDVAMGSQSSPATDPVKYRGDMKWEAASAEDYKTVNPVIDSLLAVKFIGDRPDGAFKMEMHVAGGSWFNRGGSKYSPNGSIKTTNNNTIYYFRLSDDGTYTGSTGFELDKINFAAADNVTDSTYVIDWIASFTSMDALIVNKDYKDDGEDDMDEAGISNDTTLSDLTIDGTTVDGFVPTVGVYNIGLQKGTTEVVVGAIANDARSVVSDTGTVDVSSGSAVAIVNVEAQDGSTMAYTINLTVANQSDNAYLHALSIDVGSLNPGFDSTIFDYAVSLPFDTKTVNVTPEKSDAIATVKGGGAIDVTPDKVRSIIEVEAEDGTIMTYSIFFKLQSEDAVKMPLATDAHIHSYSGNADNNYDDSQYMILKTKTDGSFDRLALVTVDMSTMSNFEAIDSVYMYYSFHNSHDGNIDLFKYEHDFESTTITWNNAPSTTLPSSDSITTWITDASWNRQDAYHGVDITSYAQERLAIDSLVSMALRSESSDKGFDLHSLESVADGNGVIWSPYIEIYGKLAAGEVSNDATLSDLKVDGTRVDGFNSSITNYTVILPELTTSVTLSATTTNGNATIVGDGVVDVASGAEKADVVVTAEDSETKQTYTVTFFVGSLPSDNAYLDTIITDVGSLIPVFDSAIFTYTINVPASTTTVNLTAVESHSGAVPKGDGAIDVSGGDITANIVVIAENTFDSLTYEINIKVLSNDATLSSLTASVGLFDPVFDPATTDYDLTVPKGTTIVNLSAAATHDNAVVEGLGSVNVSSGSGSVTITVTSEDGTETKDYLVDINVETGSNISGIKSENINVYPNPTVDKLYVEAELGSELSIYDISGQIISSKIAEGNTTSFEFSDYSAGTYILLVSLNNESSRTIIIKK